LGDKVRITDDLLKEGGELIESVDLLFLAPIEWVRVKVLVLAVL
jgi:adenine/guanine phosphoribosyltransferase-like PRPP-binding protein